MKYYLMLDGWYYRGTCGDGRTTWVAASHSAAVFDDYSKAKARALNLGSVRRAVDGELAPVEVCTELRALTSAKYVTQADVDRVAELRRQQVAAAVAVADDRRIHHRHH